jgi:ribosomal peptide maturation radical SAM protein 1
MPFGNLLLPSIGLGLLKSALTRESISAKVFHFEFQFARLIGEQNYERVYAKTHTEHLAGEFIFAPSLFGQELSVDVTRYVDEVLRRAGSSSERQLYPETMLAKLNDLLVEGREHAEGFLDESLDTIVSHQPTVVGFTSLFQQHVASLALAKRIKARLPSTFIVFGGANCEGPMGYETLRQFEFVDAVVSGEADFVFPEIVRRVLHAKPVSNLRGVFSRQRSELRVVNQVLCNTPTVEDLDKLPLPDYDEYFAQQNDNSLDATTKPSLLFETSRGCWWGEKHHCTFCGLNGETMAYRSKSPSRAISEFIYLTERYPVDTVNVVDNILDMNYFKDFIPLLAERKHGLSLFYEVKANLRKDQLQLLCDAGVANIQPGIESLSDGVLRIMRKGVSALQNIQLIKWCKELGLKPYYNLISGFPGEQADDYREMARLIPLITHLQPPAGEGTIRIDRFSPNFEQSESLGFRNLSPHSAYRYVYPFGSEILSNLAYFFTSEQNPPITIAESIKAFADEVKLWKDCHRKSDLFWIDKGTNLLIWDFRPIAKERLVVLKGHERFSYLACDQIRTCRQVVDVWREHFSDSPIDQSRVGDCLDSLTDRGLMVKRENSYLSLAYAKSMVEAATQLKES